MSSCRLCQSSLEPGDVIGVCTRCLAKGLVASERDKESTDGAVPVSESRYTQLGNYRLMESIGQGGMGRVYRARQAGANRDVALKVIHGHLVNNVRSEARFLAEAEAAATLDHPHIVPIHEVGTTDETPFYTMKLVRGESMEALPLPVESTGTAETRRTTRLRKRSTALRARIELLAKVAEAVHYAHEHGVLHRDLKPSNILVDEAGEPNVIDFGLAKRLDGDVSLTLTGELIGTPAYMAPEQTDSRAQSQSIAVDVYGLGGLIHFCLTGRPPFGGSTPVEILNRVQSEDVAPLSILYAWVDVDLSTITLKCLEKEASHRYDSAEAVAEDLRRWLRGEAIHARPTSGWERFLKWCRRRPFAASLTAAALIVIGGLSLQLGLTYRRAVTSEAETQVTNARLGRTLELSRNRLADEHIARGDVGKALAYLAANLRDRGVESGSLAFLKHLIEEHPFARRLGPPLEHVDEVQGIVFHPDGLRIATSCFDGAARIWRLETGELAVPPLRHAEAVYRIDFSPDGNRILTGAYDSSARVWDANTGEPISPPLYHKEVPLVAYFSPDGERIITAGLGAVAKIWRGDGLGEPLLTLQHDRKRFAIHIAVLVPGREQLITGSVDGSLWLWDLESGELIQELALAPGYQSDVVLGPRGDRFVVLAMADPQLWSLNPAEQLQRLRHVGGQVWSAAFSGDGKVVSTVSDQRLIFWDAESGHRLGLVSGGIDSTSRVRRLEATDGIAFFNHDTVFTSQASQYEPVYGAITAAETIGDIHPDPEGRRVAIRTRKQTVSVWEWSPPVEREVVYRSPVGKRDDLVGFVLDAEKRSRLVLGTYSGRGIRTVDYLKGGSTEGYLDSDLFNLALVSWPHQRLVAVLADRSGGLSLVDTKTEQVHEIKDVKTVDSLALSPDGQWLVGEVSDGSGIWRYSTAEGRLVGELLRVEGEASVCQFSDDSRFLVAGRRLGGVKVWTVADWSELGEKRGRWGQSRALAISPDSQTIAVGSDDGILRLFSLAGTLVEEWQVDLGSTVKSVLFSRDGRRVLAGTLDGEISVWQRKTGHLATALMVHAAEIYRLALHPDGRTLMAVYSDQNLRFWDSLNSTPLSTLLPWYGGTGKEGNRFGMGPIANLSPDGRHYSVGLSDGRVEVRTVPVPESTLMLPDWLAEFAEAWGGVRLVENDRIQVVPWEDRVALFERVESMAVRNAQVEWAQQLLRGQAARIAP